MTWTSKHIRQRVIEAAQTCQRLPRASGPQSYGNAMPEPIRALQEAYGYSHVKVKIPPTGKDIAEMEQTWDWINSLPDKKQRIEVYSYGYIKTKKGLSFAKYLEKNDIHRRNFERQINKLFQIIADIINQNHKIRNQAPSLQVSQNLTYERPVKRDKSRSNSWMAEGARPTIVRSGQS